MTAGTGRSDFRTEIAGANLRGLGLSGSATATSVDCISYHAKVRFNDASVDVVKANAGVDSYPFNSDTSSIVQYLEHGIGLGTGGKITKIYLQSGFDALASDYANQVIKMGHTTLNQLTVTYADNMDDATIVSSGNYSIPVGLKEGDWIEIPLQTPFVYDASKNLVIEIANDGKSANNGIILYASSHMKRAYSIDRTAETAVGTYLYGANLRLEIEK